MSVRVPFGKYELVERLASGGMGETWLADLNAMEGVTKQVVIKKMLPELAQSPDRVRAFIDEARLSATLSHGNIAQLFDFGQVEGEYYLALEFVDGQSLERVLARAKKLGLARLPFSIGVYIVTKLLDALHYAHTRVDQNGQPLNLVHRDVSPDNVLLSYDGEVKLVDFGIAKTSELGRSQTMPGMVKGKYRYHSPEQALAKKLDRRSDIFGAGIVLFELLSGGPMFVGQGHVVMQQVADGDIPQLRARAADVPEELAVVAMKALAKEPDDRFPTARQMQEQLSVWLSRRTPDFSVELVRELMLELFEKELTAAGTPPVRNARVSEQLRALKTEAKTDPVPPPSGASVPSSAPGGRGLLLAAVAAVVLLAGGGGVALWQRSRTVSEEPGCEHTADAALASGDERAARQAFLQCLGVRPPTLAEATALTLIDTCANQRARLKEAELGLSKEEPDRAERALAFAPASCVAARHGELTAKVRALRDQPPQPDLPALPDAPAASPRNPEANALFLEARAATKSATYDGYKKAKALLLQCVKLDPEHSGCFYELGLTHGYLGESAASVKAYEKFVELAPADPRASKVRGLLDSRKPQP